MKYVLTGSAGNITRPLAEKLLKAGHDVTVIGRNAEHLKSLADAGAKIAPGSVEDANFLAETFKGADAVYTMIPPKLDAADWKSYIGSIGEKYAAAIKTAGVKYVVNLSSVGAHLPEGVGPVSGLYRVEQALNKLEGVNVKHLRPAYFYYNLLANINLIKHAGIIGGNFSAGDKQFTIVHPSEIAEAAAEELLNLNFTGKSVRYIVSDEVSTDQIASELGAAIGKPELKWVKFTNEQSIAGMQQAGFSEEVAKNYTEMGEAIDKGKMSEDYYKNRPASLGRIKLKDFAKEFAAIYNA
ncbi:MAG: NAD(P)H-binding protein [Chitinophagaceae bacterium]|nr:NAD(P)H-binding protein [Chitinophagaceae bacterium]